MSAFVLFPRQEFIGKEVGDKLITEQAKREK